LVSQLVRRIGSVGIMVIVLVAGFFLGSYTTPKVTSITSTTIYETKNVTTTETSTETTTETTTITTSEPSYNYFFSLAVNRVSHDASRCRIVVSFSTRNAYVMETDQRFKQIISYLNSSTVEGIT